MIYHLFLAFTVHEYHSCYFHVEKTMIIIPEIFNHGKRTGLNLTIREDFLWIAGVVEIC